MKHFLWCRLIALLFCPLLTASDWAQFRGPDRNGRSVETGLLNQWSENGPRELWRVKIGSGFSSISISGERAYTMDADETTEYALCVDKRTGKQIWRKPMGTCFINEYGNGPRATPTVVGGTVFALGSSGLLRALQSSNGDTLWEVNFVDKFSSKVPRWAFCASPLVIGDSVIVEVGGEDSALAAFDAKTGALKWQSEKGLIAYSSPIALTFKGVDQILHVTKESLVSLDHQGKQLWTTPYKPNLNIKPAIPVFVEPDLIFLSASYDAGATLVRMKAGGAEQVWDNRTAMRNHFNACVALGPYIYGFDKAMLKCILAETGEATWVKRGYGKGSLIYADGKFIVLSELGKLALLTAEEKVGKELASHQVLNGRSWTQPSLSEGCVYVRNHTEMVGLDLRGKK